MVENKKQKVNKHPHIRVHISTKKELDKRGKKVDSYDSVIRKLLNKKTKDVQ